MNRIVGIKKKAAMGILLLAFALLYCAGCSQREDSLPPLSLEESKVEEGQTSTDRDATEKKEQVEESGQLPIDKRPKEEPDSVFVYVCGAVRVPGVYELERGSRIYQALAFAGGMTEEAADSYVNQAKELTDGEQIYIPTKEEIEKGLVENISPSTENHANESKQGSVNIDINTASKEELMTLSGIGASRAESIIRYREDHGAFSTIDDLMNVEGIKEGVFEKIKDRITVNTGS